MKDTAYYDRLWLVAFVPTFACLVAFTLIEEIHVPHILQLQFSGNYMDWAVLVSNSKRDVLVYHHYFDFIFILCYSLLFIMSFRLISFAMDLPVKKIGLVLCLVPGFFDVLENGVFLKLISDSAASYYTAYTWLVFGKWSFLIFFLQMVITILVYYVMDKLYRLARVIFR